MKISVIIPSRLQPNPNMSDVYDADPELWLDRAVTSVLRQTVGADAEILVAIDPSAPPLPVRFRQRCGTVVAAVPGQAGAVNTAVRLATGDVIATLEDDDYWEHGKLAAQLDCLQHYDLITCNARETTWDGAFIRMNDFPTPSGWLMRREIWERVGGMDESFRFHVDTEWLGRANRAGLRRLHLVEDGATFEKPRWLAHVVNHSEIGQIGAGRPLVNRTANPEGGMALIASDAAAAAQSKREHKIMMERFGGIPW